MWELILLLPLLTASVSAFEKGDLKVLRPCFERYPNHKLVGMKSYHAEFRMASEEECLHFCALTATRCRSIVYDSAKHLCHFFLDDGAEQAEFAPRMIYFRVTKKECLESVMAQLPENGRALTTSNPETTEREFKSPVVARKHGGKFSKRKYATLDSDTGLTTTTTTTTTTMKPPPTLEDMGMKDAMNDLVDDIERNTEMFEAEQRKEEQTRDEEEREELKRVKEQIRKKLKEKIETLRTSYPDMYEELLGGDDTASEKEVKKHEIKINDGEIERRKIARAPEKVIKAPTNVVSNDEDDEKKESPVEMISGDSDEEPVVNKKFLAVPDAVSEEIDYEDDEKTDIRKSPSKKTDDKKSELKKNTFSKAQLFAQQLGGTVSDDADVTTTTRKPITTTTTTRKPYRRTINSRRKGPPARAVVTTTTTTQAPVPISMEQPKFSIKRRPVVDDETADGNAPVTGCLDDEIPLWVRFENAEPDLQGPGASAPVESREACEAACSEVDGARSMTYSEKNHACQCNVDFDGVSMKRSASDDFSVSTSTRFCFSNSLTVFQNCGYFMGFRDFTLNVSPREQFDGLPPSYEGLQLCIELCTLSTDYACKSASFDFHAGRCSLNDADSTTHPTDFAPTLVDNLLYFENSCERADAFLQKESQPAPMTVNRVAASDVDGIVAAPTGGIGGLKVRPLTRDSYSLKNAGSVFVHRN